MADQEAMFVVLRRFAHAMARSYDIADSLHELSENMVEVLDVDACGVALCDGPGLRFVTATSPAAVEAEQAQERMQAGPCYTSLEARHPVAVRDIRRHHDEWPEFAVAVERAGFLGVLGLPLVLDDRRVGSLNLYDTEPRHWTEETISAGAVFADIGAAFILNASQLAQSQRTAQQLQTALDSRIVIEQAKGVLAERAGVTPAEAFTRLRAHARSHNEKIHVVCRRVIDTDFTLT